MAAIKADHEERLARLEHMMEELRVQTNESIRLTTEARLETKAAKEKSQRERAAANERLRSVVRTGRAAAQANPG